MRSRVGVLAGLAGILLLSLPAPRVPAEEGQHPAVTDLTQRGVLRGYPSGKYQPDKPITRLELAIVVSRLLRAIESNPHAAQRPAPPLKKGAAARLPAGVPAWARTDVTYLAQRGYTRTLPALCKQWDRPVRQKELSRALVWALSSLAQRGYIPPGDLAAPPAEPEVKP